MTAHSLRPVRRGIRHKGYQGMSHNDEGIPGPIIIAIIIAVFIGIAGIPKEQWIGIGTLYTGILVMIICIIIFAVTFGLDYLIMKSIGGLLSAITPYSIQHHVFRIFFILKITSIFILAIIFFLYFWLPHNMGRNF